MELLLGTKYKIVNKKHFLHVIIFTYLYLKLKQLFSIVNKKSNYYMKPPTQTTKTKQILQVLNCTVG